MIAASIYRELIKAESGVFQISGFLVNLLQNKIVITPEPVMILT